MTYVAFFARIRFPGAQCVSIGSTDSLDQPLKRNVDIFAISLFSLSINLIFGFLKCWLKPHIRTRKTISCWGIFSLWLPSFNMFYILIIPSFFQFWWLIVFLKHQRTKHVSTHSSLNVFEKRKLEKLKFSSFLVLSPPINSVFHILGNICTSRLQDFLEINFCTPLCTFLSTWFCTCHCTCLSTCLCTCLIYQKEWWQEDKIFWEKVLSC